MRLLIIGINGQVARSLGDCKNTHQEFEFIFAGRDSKSHPLDLCDPQSIGRVISAVKPDIVINVAAYTAVDQAEDEPDLAYRINAEAPGVLALEAKKNSASVIHISTDYVFDGTSNRPYNEKDKTSPLGVYGNSKLEGEKAVVKANSNHLILRTAWVYSPYGKNFYKTMLALSESKSELSVVDDQTGNPTSASEIAQAIMSVCKAWQSGSKVGIGQIYHFAGKHEMSWAQFAASIFEYNSKKGGNPVKVIPISSEKYKTKAKRPANSRLNRNKFISDFGQWFAPGDHFYLD